ncbi:MAG: hypothetical protein ACI4WW_02480 [Candidatus Coprovivens sp.]
MKKKTKIILLTIVFFIILFGVMFLIDMNRVKQLKKPIFCIENGYMGSMKRFDGLGYKIGLNINAITGKITYGQMTMLGQFIVKLYSKDEDITLEEVNDMINKIIENGPMTSSNPFHYVEASKDIYDELLAHPKETFEYSIKDLIDTNADNGLKSYIEALLCSNINTNFKYDFESANDYLDNYKKYLEKNNIEFNDYDNYTKKILK